jgi:tetratricopeptide (TPR) repeat protein
VGRSEEVQRLGGLLRRVRTGVVYGLPGVGKSALVAAVAERYRGPVVYRRIRPGDTLDTVVDDVRRLLREAPVAQALSDASRLEDLARELEERRALCVLDDLHGLKPEERAALLEELGGRLRQGALLATSREAVPRHAASPDRFELRLDGLPEPAARVLWEQLDSLYGHREGFGVAWARSRGLPFLLRRAHAGDGGDEEPVRAALEALPADERRLAAVLALSEVPLPARALQHVLPGSEPGEVLRRLSARLLVETDAQGRHGVHDLVREALGTLLGPEEARSAHEALLEVLSREPLPAVVRVRAVCRHLQALGRHQERAAFIVEQAGPLVRHGAAAELLSLLGSLPPALRTAEVRLARARALVRLLDLRRAHAELLELRAAVEGASEGDALREGVNAVLVRVALFSMELDTCERTLGSMPMPAEPEALLQQLLAWATLRFFQGRLDEGLDMLNTAAAGTEDRHVMGWAAYASALMLWVDGQDGALAEPVNRCMALLEDAPLDSRGPLVTAMSAGILSRLGRFEEAEAAMASARERLGRLGAPRLALELDTVGAWMRAEQGERRAALARFKEAEARSERAGYFSIGVLSRVGAGRMLLELGRRAEGLAVLDALEADLTRWGARGLVHAAEVARAMDVLRQMEAPATVEPREVRPGVAARQRAVAALQAALRGDSVRAVGLLASLEPLTRGEDFALERALGHLARAQVHRLAGRASEAQASLEEAARAAAEGEVDPELIPELARARAPGGAASEGARATPEAAAGAPDAVVLDARQHELRVSGRTVSLAKRVLPRRLLYALARQPGRTLPKEACVRAMWDADYDPRLHDNALRVHVRHVREMLEGTGTRVVFEDPGYRLEVSEGFTFLHDEPGAS